jgi:hypothetical protein
MMTPWPASSVTSPGPRTTLDSVRVLPNRTWRLASGHCTPVKLKAPRSDKAMRLNRLPTGRSRRWRPGISGIGFLVTARHHGRNALARQLHRQHHVRQGMVALPAEAADQHHVAGPPPDRGIDGKLAVGGVLGLGVDLALHVVMARHQRGRGRIEVADPQLDVEFQRLGMGHAVVGRNGAAARHLTEQAPGGPQVTAHKDGESCHHLHIQPNRLPAPA